ncbi:MAG: DUF5597 domain-containing protein [Massilia sp.]
MESQGRFPDNSETPSGGVVVAKLADDEYLVTGQNARISFGAGKDLKDRGMVLDRVEEGRFENGKWTMLRVWNGDQVVDGLNFTDRAQVLKVKLGTYVK